MKRIISILLVFACMLTWVPLTVAAEDVVYPEDENIADKGYLEDVIIFSQTGAPMSTSSGGITTWNRFYPSKYSDGMTDPVDPTNTVGRHFVGYDSGREIVLTKSLGIPTEGEFVWESNLMIAPPTEGDYPLCVQVRLLGETVATFTYRDGVTYTYEIAGATETGCVAAGEWMRITAHVLCGGQGLAAEDTMMRTAVTLPDGTTHRATYIGGRETVSMNYGITMGEGSVGGIYLDDVYLYVPGDFGTASVATDVYEDDIYGNYPLDGNVTFQLYHRVDPAKVDPAALKLYNTKGEAVPYTGITWSPTRPDVVTLNFSSHPLDKDSEYRLVFPENTMDLTGRLMKETEILFRTYGEAGEWRAPVAVVTPPAGGYVMPDIYNTGYRCDSEELIDFETKYPGLIGNSEVIITEAIAREYNYEFSHFVLENAVLHVTATSPVYIHDALFLNSGMHNGRSGRTGYSSRATVAWCEGTGSGDFFGGKNLTISHCYIHDVKDDHMKANSGQIVEYCYFRDGGTHSPAAHADVVQFMGSTDEVLNDIRFYGNRFDAPYLGWEHVSNCILFFKPEGNTQGFSNVQVIGNWLNGGGYTMYITPVNGVEQLKYLTYRGNKIGYGEVYGPLRINIDTESVSEDRLIYENNERIATLEAGSIVYYDADGHRVWDVGELSGTASVLVNLANYTTDARNYRISVSVVDAAGKTLSTYNRNGSVRRYIPVKEYYAEDNVIREGPLYNERNDLYYKDYLINDPDHPHDVPDTLTLTGLPTDMTGCRLEVTVYDTTAEETVIRTSALTHTVLENHRMPGVTYPEAPVAADAQNYAYAEDAYHAVWAGKSATEILSSGVLYAPAENLQVSASGVLTIYGAAAAQVYLRLQDQIGAGPARLMLDYYHNSDCGEIFRCTIGGRSLLTIAPDGTVTAGGSTTDISDGWNTIECLVFPYDSDGNLVIGGGDVSRTDVYVRVGARTDAPADCMLFGSQLDAYMRIEDFGIENHLAGMQIHLGYESGGEMQIANLSAMELIPHDTYHEMTVQYPGGEQTIHMPTCYSDLTYRLPDTEGVTWLCLTADGLRVCPDAAVTVDGSEITVIGAEESYMKLAGAGVTLDARMGLFLLVDETTLPKGAEHISVIDSASGLAWEIKGKAEEGYITLPLTGIDVQRMGQVLTLSVVAEVDGAYYISAAETTYSILHYIERVYRDVTTTATVKSMLAAMLQYGAALEAARGDGDAVAQCAANLGVSITDETPTGYTAPGMTDEDSETIANWVEIEAALEEGAVLSMKALSGDVVAVRMSCGGWRRTYYKNSNGDIIVDGLHAASVINTYRMEFLHADGTTADAADFVFGNFLDGETNVAEDPLARATLIYMMRMRSWAPQGM